MSDGSRERDRAVDADELLTALPDPVLVVDDDGDYVDANPAACDLFGHDRAALLGRNVSEFASADYDVSTAWDRFLAEGAATGEFELVRPDGDRRTVEFTATAAVTPGRHLATLRDVTDRRRIEADLRESETRFRQIVGRVEETIWMAEAETTELLYVSPGIEALTGRPPAYFVDDPIWNFVADVHPDDAPAARAAVEQWLADVESGDPDDEYHFQFRYVRSDDAVAWLHVDASVVTDAAGRPDRIVGIIDDVTDMKCRERELERKNERLEEFAGMVSHDLRNPLQVVVGRVALLREEGVAAESVADIGRAADRMAQLIDDLLTLARGGDDVDTVEPVSLEVVASQAWGTVASTDASFAVVDRAVVTADEGRLRQLFENLFRNAIEHAGSAVAVEVGVVRDDGVATGFYVADDGPGIPPADCDRVFEPGFSTAADGTGFGLDIVAVVAAAHGWSVAITESAEGGARFEFTDVDVA
ncbi:PAS domain S-box protein [Halobacteria archaeon HArc-gm2]|nr:PAS domain S-box protein [Halobacteria archaeon HArc-gm2]